MGGKVIKQVHWLMIGLGDKLVGSVNADGEVKEVDTFLKTIRSHHFPHLAALKNSKKL